MSFITKILIVVVTLLVALSGCSRVSSNTGLTPRLPEYRVIGQSVTAGESKNFYYDALSDAEKRGYDKIKTAVTEFTDFVTFDDPLSQIQIEKLFHLVYTQENGIFWLSELASANGDTNSLKMTLRMDSGDAKAMQAKLDEMLRIITMNAPEKDSFEQVRYIHDYIVKNCKFSAEGDNINSAYGAIVDGEAQCEGYAFAFGLLAKKLGFECVTVTGTSEAGQSHAWNKILLDGNWVNVDCTWDDPVISFDNPDYIRYYYLLVPDRDIMNISHFENTDYVKSPDATATACNYFYKTGLLFADSGAAGVSIYDQIVRAFPARQTEIEIRFDAKRAYDDTVTYLYDSKGLTGIIDRVNAEKNAGIKNAYHSENDNLFIIHISLVYS